MELTLYQVDAFARRPFEGNPAAVVPLDSWLEDEVMQAIANENNLSETAFFVSVDQYFEIRWFTPLCEVDLCGHATLAAAWVVFNELDSSLQSVEFHSRSGVLSVSKSADGMLEMDFPAQPCIPCIAPEPIERLFGRSLRSCQKNQDYLVVLANESDVINARPDTDLLRQLNLRGLCITAESQEYDFVTRFFAPKAGIDEDPVTGSAFTQLAPFWATMLGKTTLRARQVSSRGGIVECSVVGDRVYIRGSAVKYLEGRIVTGSNPREV